MIPEQIDSYSFVYEYINNLIAGRTMYGIDKQAGMTEISFDTNGRP